MYAKCAKQFKVSFHKQAEESFDKLRTNGIKILLTILRVASSGRPGGAERLGIRERARLGCSLTGPALISEQ